MFLPQTVAIPCGFCGRENENSSGYLFPNVSPYFKFQYYGMFPGTCVSENNRYVSWYLSIREHVSGYLCIREQFQYYGMFPGTVKKNTLSRERFGVPSTGYPVGKNWRREKLADFVAGITIPRHGKKKHGGIGWCCRFFSYARVQGFFIRKQNPLLCYTSTKVHKPRCYSSTSSTVGPTKKPPTFPAH